MWCGLGQGSNTSPYTGRILLQLLHRLSKQRYQKVSRWRLEKTDRLLPTTSCRAIENGFAVISNRTDLVERML